MDLLTRSCLTAARYPDKEPFHTFPRTLPCVYTWLDVAAQQYGEVSEDLNYPSPITLFVLPESSPS